VLRSLSFAHILIFFFPGVDAKEEEGQERKERKETQEQGVTVMR
jgi:hypothetical protein